MDCTDTDSDSGSLDIDIDKDCSFMYINIHIHNIKVAALLDSGSNINIISESLFSKVPDSFKHEVDYECGESLKLANACTVSFVCHCQVKVRFSSGTKSIPVYVIKESAHALI